MFPKGMYKAENGKLITHADYGGIVTPYAYCHCCNMNHTSSNSGSMAIDYRHRVIIHRFLFGRPRISSKKLNLWQNEYDKWRRIDDMSVFELEKAILYIESGFKCFGQRSKIVSLKRVLKEKTNG